MEMSQNNNINFIFFPFRASITLPHALLKLLMWAMTKNHVLLAKELTMLDNANVLPASKAPISIKLRQHAFKIPQIAQLGLSLTLQPINVSKLNVKKELLSTKQKINAHPSANKLSSTIQHRKLVKLFHKLAWRAKLLIWRAVNASK